MIELSIPELLPSLNRMGGAGRGHWTAWTKDKRRWEGWVLVAKHNQAKMGGMNPRFVKARVEIDRHCVADIRDEDNLRAGTKFLMDALVAHGLLKDDSRDCVGIPQIRQIRCKKGEQRTVVRIYQLDDLRQRSAGGAEPAPRDPARDAERTEQEEHDRHDDQ